MTLVAFNVAVIVQEFYRGVRARQRSSKQGEPETALVALFRLVEKSRRRYGGYIVHLGICAMFLGFGGTSWNIDREHTLVPGQTEKIGRFELTYEGSRVCPGNPRCSPEEQADLSKRMIFADVSVRANGQDLGRMSPAKFIFNKSPDGPTTEVALRRSLREDLYLIIGGVDPETKRAMFKFHVNPFVSWIWVGLLVLIAGTTLSLWPEMSLGTSRVWAFGRAGGAAASGIMLSLWLAMAPAAAHAAPRPASAHVTGVTLAAESPLPRLFREGLWWPIALGLTAGAAASFVLGRRRRDDDSEALPR
jgi:cytochrome c-type biogenesis protein CcmF